MSSFRSPVKLFAYSGIASFIVRELFPPLGANNLHSWVRFFDFRLDLTGYGFLEFVGLVFLISAVTYWLALRLTNRPPNPTLVQVHYWPTLVFAVFSFFLAHWVNRIPEAALHDPGTHALLVAFSWAFAAFFVFQLIFAIGGIRGMWRNKIPVSNSEIGP